MMDFICPSCPWNMRTHLEDFGQLALIAHTAAKHPQEYICSNAGVPPYMVEQVAIQALERAGYFGGGDK